MGNMDINTLAAIVAFFVIAVMVLLELVKLRRAVEHLAYRREIHEIIEESDDGVFETKETKIKVEDGDEPKAQQQASAAAPKKVYRKTKIRVVAED